MSVAGLEPAEPASLAQYLCQFGYTDINFFWSPGRGSNPQRPHFKCSSYASSDTGRFGAITPRDAVFRHREIWCPYSDSNREIDGPEPPAYAIPP